MQETLKLYTKLQLTSKSWGLLQESLRLYRKNLTEYYIISWIKRVSRLVLTYDLLENRRLFNITINYFLLCYHTKKDFIMPWVCTAIDHRRRENVARTSPSAAALVPLFCSYLNLALSVIYCWTDPRHLLIYLWNGVQILRTCLIFLSAYSIFFFLTHSCRGWWGWMRLL